jgi:hypothetical protein
MLPSANLGTVMVSPDDFGGWLPNFYMTLEVIDMERIPCRDEIDRILKKVELGFELEEWEIWVYKVF